MTKNHRGHNCQGALCHKLLVEVFGLIGPLETEKYMIKSHFSALIGERNCLQVSAMVIVGINQLCPILLHGGPISNCA